MINIQKNVFKKFNNLKVFYKKIYFNEKIYNLYIEKNYKIKKLIVIFIIMMRNRDLINNNNY